MKKKKNWITTPTNFNLNHWIHHTLLILKNSHGVAEEKTNTKLTIRKPPFEFSLELNLDLVNLFDHQGSYLSWGSNDAMGVLWRKKMGDTDVNICKYNKTINIYWLIIMCLAF